MPPVEKVNPFGELPIAGNDHRYCPLQATLSKDYRIWLSDRAYLVVDFVMYGGRVLSFVVRLMRVTEHGEMLVARYDTAHEMPHRDMVSRFGEVIRKEWLEGVSMGEALTFAIKDSKSNHERYIEAQEESWFGLSSSPVPATDGPAEDGCWHRKVDPSSGRETGGRGHQTPSEGCGPLGHAGGVTKLPSEWPQEGTEGARARRRPSSGGF